MMQKEKILPLSEQARVKNEWLDHRLHHILPEIMKRTEIDMWVVLAREYNEDPVLESLFPGGVMTASRLTGLIFFRNSDGEVERFSLNSSQSSGPFSRFYTPLWRRGEETQWERLRKLIDEKQPRTIGVNRSEKSAHADGLSAYLYDQLRSILSDEYTKRIVSAEDLVIGWMETRSHKELDIYSGINHIIHSIIDEAFSLDTIHVGVTTTTDLEWWMMEQVRALGLRPWFPFDVDVQRRGEEEKRKTDTVIKPGDLLHCDVGLDYLGLKTDTQRLAYVVPLGEDDAPEGLKTALRTANRFQDIVCENFITGKTGNEILSASLQQAESENIKAQLYTHPIGYYGHGPGPVMGLWDNQDHVPGSGDNILYPDTCYALELNIAQRVPEWDNQEVFIFLEQTVAFTGENIKYLDGRQTELILVR
jgi:Xaa-Pro aminopeptidase